MAGINSARVLLKNRKKYRKIKKVRYHTFPCFKGIVVSPLQKEAKQPSSGKRQCWRVKCRVGTVVAYSPLDGIRNMINVHDVVTITSMGGSNGRSMGDIPGARYKIIKIGRKVTRELFLGKIE